MLSPQTGLNHNGINAMLITFAPLFIVSVYAILIFCFACGWHLLPEEETEEAATDTLISVVVPFRDEARTLPTLLEHISMQTHKSYELILINDHSTDTFLPIIQPYQAKMPSLKLIDAHGYGKKNALKESIAQAKGRLIVCTDADCCPSPRWLQSIAQFQNKKNLDLIIGPVKMVDKNSLFSHLQALEFASLIGSGAGASSISMPIMCNGANIAFTPEVWRKSIALLHEDEASGDDMFLLMSVKKQRGKISFLKSKDAMVETGACHTLRGFINQRKRWVSKSKSYTDKQVISVGLLVFLVSMLEVVYLVAAIFHPPLWVAAGMLWAIKTVADATLILSTASFLGTKQQLKYIPVLSFIYPFYVLASFVGGLFGSFSWKGTTSRVS